MEESGYSIFNYTLPRKPVRLISLVLGTLFMLASVLASGSGADKFLSDAIIMPFKAIQALVAYPSTQEYEPAGPEYEDYMAAGRSRTFSFIAYGFGLIALLYFLLVTKIISWETIERAAVWVFEFAIVGALTILATIGIAVALAAFGMASEKALVVGAVLLFGFGSGLAGKLLAPFERRAASFRAR